MARSESGGRKRHITVNSLNLREYESSNQTSGIPRTLYKIARKKSPHRVANDGGKIYGME